VKSSPSSPAVELRWLLRKARQSGSHTTRWRAKHGANKIALSNKVLEVGNWHKMRSGMCACRFCCVMAGGAVLILAIALCSGALAQGHSKVRWYLT
jgi:hypothetical protein